MMIHSGSSGRLKGKKGEKKRGSFEHSPSSVMQ